MRKTGHSRILSFLMALLLVFSLCIPTFAADQSDGSTVAAASDQERSKAGGSDLQYGYDETPASQVSVWVTINSDGLPIIGSSDDNSILAHTKVTVPYFDLENYGLQKFNRYGTDGGKGPYTDKDLIRRPTLLHLYLYLLEHYYMGLPWDECGKGTSGVLEYEQETVIHNMLGDEAYVGNLKALNITGSPTSLYCQQFWGHDENLMYYRNHVFPLMEKGWGSTADYILLSDDDTIDVAMFSDWNFWSDGGAFACFNEDSYEGKCGEEIEFRTLKYETRAVENGGAEEFLPVSTLNVALYDEDYQQLQTVSGENGVYHLTLPEKAGTYYLLGLDPKAGTPDARFACATAKVTVTGTPYAGCLFDSMKSDLSEATLTDFTSGTCFIDHFSSPGEFPYYKVKIPKDTTTVTIHYPAGAVEELQSMCALFDPESGDVSWDYSEGSDYTFTVEEADDGGSNVIVPAAFLIENDLGIALESGSDYYYFNTFGFEYGDFGGKVPVTNVTVMPDSVELNVGDTVQLEATVEPEDADNKIVSWRSSAFDIAEVSKTGLVKAKEQGTADITVKTQDGDKTAVCKVKVVDPGRPPVNSEDGYFEISTAEEFLWFAHSVNKGNETINARLMKDIDLAPVCSPTAGSWEPIGNQMKFRSYQGTFDGQGHTISNLYISEMVPNVSSGENYDRALFGQCSGGAVLKNFTVRGSVESDARFVSGICASMRSGTMENCHNYADVRGYTYGTTGVLSFATAETKVINCSNHGNIRGKGGSTAGIVGQGYMLDIESCYNTGDILCSDYNRDAFGSVGGIVGQSSGYENKIRNCYNTGRVSMDDPGTGASSVGGIIGLLRYIGSEDVEISGCYNAGEVSSTGHNAHLGGVLGHVEQKNGSQPDVALQNCFYLDSVSATDNYGAVAKTDAQMRSADFVTVLNGAGTAYKRGAAYPILHWQSDEEVPPEILLGDLDGNGTINGDDATIVYAIAKGEKSATMDERKLADVNGDGKVNSFDVSLIYAVANGVIPAFPTNK